MQQKIRDGVEEFSKIFTIPWPLTHKKGIKLGVIENKKQSELKKLLMLGQKALSEEKIEEITLHQEEVIIGVKLGLRLPNYGKGKKEEGLVASIQFAIATI